jgi:hypothetical protein
MLWKPPGLALESVDLLAAVPTFQTSLRCGNLHVVDSSLLAAALIEKGSMVGIRMDSGKWHRSRPIFRKPLGKLPTAHSHRELYPTDSPCEDDNAVENPAPASNQ